MSAAAWLAASRAGAAGAVSSAPGDIQALRRAATYHVTVEQAFGDASDVELPFAAVLAAQLEAAGLRETGADRADVTLAVRARGEPVPRDYDTTGEGSVRNYSGATLSGRCDVLVHGTALPAFSFDAAWEPPDIIVKDYPSPSDAPFIEPFGDYVFKACDWVARALGPGPALKLLNGLDASQTASAAETAMSDVPQMLIAAAQAAATYGRAESIPELRALLAADDPPSVAAASRGLGIAGDHDSLPALVDRLDADDGKLRQVRQPGNVAEGNLTGGWDTLLTDLDLAVEPRDDSQGIFDPGNEVLAAVSRLYRPSDRELLLTSLADRHSVMRRIDAAVVLGRARDPGAVAALLAALKDDDDDVRLAAIAALGAIGDRRAVPALDLIAKTKDDSGGDTLESTAAENALANIAPPPQPPAAKKD